MSFDSRECWDCPSPILPVLLWLLLGMALLVLSVALAQRHSRVRVLGYCLFPVVALWYLAIPGFIWRFGVIWIAGVWYPPRNPRAWRMSRAADLALAVGWYAVSLLFIAEVWKRRRTDA